MKSGAAIADRGSIRRKRRTRPLPLEVMDSTHSWRRFRGSGQPDFRAPIEVWKIGLSEQLVSRSLNPELNDLSVSERNKAAQGAATSHFRMNSAHTLTIEMSLRSPATSRLCQLMDRSVAQLGLFGSLEGFPEGFSYEQNILSLEEERTLVRAIAGLPLKAFEFQGFQGKRRVVSFGWHYDFNTRGLGSAEAIPEFMLPLRKKAAGFAEVLPEALQHILVSEYAPLA
jgi:hypothetical protein